MRAVISLLWIAAILALVALGSWQIERRAWKHDLMARVEAGLMAPPVPAPSVAGKDDAYRRVVAMGTYLAGKDSFVQASTVRGPGWWVLTPLRTDAGRVILINRGYVPGRKAPPPACISPASPPYSPPWKGGVGGGSVRGDDGVPSRADPPPAPRFQGGEKCTITGLLRLTESGGGFLRANDPVADRWYSRDIAAIAARRGIAAVPYFIDADADAAADRPGQPVGGLTVVAFTDNHLLYAVTWYILGLMTLAGFLYWLGVLPRRQAA